MVWYILAGVIALLLLLAFSRLKFCIVYDDTFSVKLKFWFLRFPLYPDKKGVDPKAYSNRAQKKKRKEKHKKRAVPKPKSLADIRSMATDLTDAFSALPRYLIRHANIRANRISVTVATDDVAKTAYATGWVRNAFAFAEAALAENLNYTRKKTKDVTAYRVVPDFVGDKTDIEVDIKLYMPLYQAIIFALKSTKSFLKFKQKRSTNHDREQTE